MPKTRIAIHGAAGRMGQRLVALTAADAELQLAAAIDSPANPRVGDDAGALAGVGPVGIKLTDGFADDAATAIDVVIDFSVPTAALALLDQCVARKLPLVLATTGFDKGAEEKIRGAAKSIPLLWSPSMSLAVNLAMRLSEVAAQALCKQLGGVDVEIIERHHRFKEDSPSGTALKFGQIIADVMGQTVHQHGREGRPGQRPRNEIGYHAVRVGDNPGEHTIIFGLLGETLELRVDATSRDAYVHGALAAAKFLHSKPAGLYGMSDVLGF
ncbi:MAG: 4-hydroxy-tetrahydrodipicolinate reductase [Planctomycetia bacterium]|nr:4-hydroxy-tetrahydrodipicolinate reductase [Planctomycetia bacterium]